MTDIDIRKDGPAGRITLQRPKALNALTYEMCLAIEDALWTWRADPTIRLVLIDAEGDKAFCAGGDIAEMYATGTAGDFAYGQRFWRDEYRMNAKLADYPKPVVSFLQGFTMGGGVGVGCHGSHRVVGDSSRIAMPECGIGFVPDVGGSYLLARAPGRLGEYLGLSAARMGPGDAIHAGFADRYHPEDDWHALKQALIETGDVAAIGAAPPPPESALAERQTEIDRLFQGETLSEVISMLRSSDGSFSKDTLKSLSRNAPLSMAVTLEMIHRLRSPSVTVRQGLELEYRVSHRTMEQGDFLEGIRAAIVDKDKSPVWRHGLEAVPTADVARMLMPLGPDSLDFS